MSPAHPLDRQHWMLIRWNRHGDHAVVGFTSPEVTGYSLCDLIMLDPEPTFTFLAAVDGPEVCLDDVQVLGVRDFVLRLATEALVGYQTTAASKRFWNKKDLVAHIHRLSDVAQAMNPKE